MSIGKRELLKLRGLDYPEGIAKQQAFAFENAGLLMSEAGVATDIQEIHKQKRIRPPFRKIGNVVISRVESNLMPVRSIRIGGLRLPEGAYGRIVRSSESRLTTEAAKSFVVGRLASEDLAMDIADSYSFEYLYGKSGEHDALRLNNEGIPHEVASPRWPINPRNVDAVESMVGFTADLVDLARHMGVQLVDHSEADS